MDNKAQIFGKEIRFLRQQKHMTQKQLAEGIGTQAQISRIEKGEVIPLATTLYEIASKLGVDVNYFYNQAYIPRNDYVKEVKYQIRKAIRERDYNEVDEIIKQEENNIAFKSGEHFQFILWHKGITEFYIRRNVNQSLYYLDNAFAIGKENKKIPISIQDIEILNSKAIIFNEIKKYKESVNTYLHALENYKKIVYVSDKKVEIRIYYGLAKSLFKLSDYNQSIIYCKKGIEVCIKEEYLYLLGELHYELAQNYQSLNNEEQALNHYSIAKHLFQIGKQKIFIEIVEEKVNNLLSHLIKE